MLVDYCNSRRIEIHQYSPRVHKGGKPQGPSRYYAVIEGEALKTATGTRRSWKTQTAALREARRQCVLLGRPALS